MPEFQLLNIRGSRPSVTVLRHRARCVIVAIIALTCVLSLAPGHVLAQEPRPAVVAANAIKLRIVDANPRFLANVTLPVTQAEQWEQLAAADVTRQGAAADGESLLLIQAICQEAGSVSFALEGDSPAGEFLDPATLKSDHQFSTRPSDKLHIALAIYRPPAEFGDFRGNRRTIKLTARFTPANRAAADAAQSESFVAQLEIVRPPVVLLHGMYDAPSRLWEVTPPAVIGDQSMRAALEAQGLRVFLCDYEESNGRTFGGPSRLRDNAHVLWENPGGIRQALQTLRDEGIAVTQADIVGHSMGGLLARAYIRGQALTDQQTAGFAWPTLPRIGQVEAQAEEAAVETPESGGWYHRADNFGAGDVNRLITVCTPHLGSSIVDLILKYPTAWKDARGDMGEEARLFMQTINLLGGISSGAFLDQASDSLALAELGPTRVPSFAIACEATPASFDDYDGTYQVRFLTVCLVTPTDVLARVLSESVDTAANEDHPFHELREIVDRNPQRAQAVARTALSALVSGGSLHSLDGETTVWAQRVLHDFSTAVFEGAVHDGALTEASAYGGLPPENRVTIRHVLHSYAPSYPAVQEKICELLTGPQDAFCQAGFPALQTVDGETAEQRK